MVRWPAADLLDFPLPVAYHMGPTQDWQIRTPIVCHAGSDCGVIVDLPERLQIVRRAVRSSVGHSGAMREGLRA
jgi:hypothetical protein